MQKRTLMLFLYAKTVLNRFNLFKFAPKKKSVWTKGEIKKERSLRNCFFYENRDI